MNRAWITGLTLAAVAGTGGAAFAGMSADSGTGGTADAAAQQPAAEITTTTVDGVVTYQLGPAGTVNLTTKDGVLRVDNALPSLGWTVVTYSGPAKHIGVILTDSTQIVTFRADLVAGKVVASLSSAAAPRWPRPRRPHRRCRHRRSHRRARHRHRRTRRHRRRRATTRATTTRVTTTTTKSTKYEDEGESDDD